jgi:hypothetical protein
MNKNMNVSNEIGDGERTEAGVDSIEISKDQISVI